MKLASLIAPFAAALLALPCLAQTSTSAPATAPATAPKIMLGGDPVEFKRAEDELPGTLKALQKLLDEPNVCSDPELRAAALKKAQPLFAEIDRDVKEIARWGPGMQWQIDKADTTVKPIRAALGDPAFLETLQKQAKSDNQLEASNAKALLARAQFLAAGKDAAAQDKAVDAFAEALKADPASENLALYLANSHDDKVTAPAAADRIETILREAAKSAPKNSNAKIAVRNWGGDKKLASLPGKALNITVPKLDGTAFASNSLKGKVILVDFWATWCGPCVAELPRVTKVYNKYHEQGLEMISISCDQSAEPINKFMAKHPEITWTQLYDPKTPGWEAAQAFGINAIPTMFLIDKKGICRTVEAREKMDELIPQLLAEKAE